jgi:hypothetical protein
MVKSSLGLIKHHAMKMSGGVDLPTTWEWSASRHGRFTPGTHNLGGSVGPRAGLAAVEGRTNLLRPPGMEPRLFSRRAPSLISILNELSLLQGSDTVKYVQYVSTFRRNQLIPSCALKIEATVPCEALVPTFRTIRCHIPQNGNLHTNLKFLDQLSDYQFHTVSCWQLYVPVWGAAWGARQTQDHTVADRRASVY